MPGGTLGYGGELLLWSQGQSSEGTCALYASISNEGRCWDGEGFPMALGAPQVSVQDGGSTSSALCGYVLPLLICLLATVPVAAEVLARHFLVRLSWDPQRRQWAGYRPQDLCIHFFPGEQRQEQAAGKAWSWPCSEVITNTALISCCK